MMGVPEVAGVPVFDVPDIETVGDGLLIGEYAGLPDGEFLAVLSVPCPDGRVARGGAGGQMMTSCSLCGHVSPSTAGERHTDPMLVPVVAQRAAEDSGWTGIVFRRANRFDFNKNGEVK